ncbi:uncharacterized protein LOC107216491 [Neodiprion lecontei]|uniref:Uncharacterized protein LOC107216491 n=1 Tax=Neodiprion lecontei TaxID=441921 RepID=A0A6J0B6H2_NEOLC|nr:uncharacterized protein LOC107216491 [Neodiprion lecontei]
MNSAILYLAMGLALVSSNLRTASAGIAELLNGVDDAGLQVPPAHTSVSNLLRESLEDNSVGNSCQVEYQVTKRAVGRCVKLGRDIRACVSGTYLDPFHPECM